MNEKIAASGGRVGAGRHAGIGAQRAACIRALGRRPQRRWTASVKPGDDFFDYVNGAWAKRTEIAPDRTFVGIDSVLNDQLDRDVRAIVEDMAKNSASSGRIGQQVGDFYASWMDEAAIAAKGTAPLKPLSRPDRRGEGQGRSGRSVRDGRLSLADRHGDLPRPVGPDPICRLCRPGRARHAQPRLLPAGGRQI